MKTNKNQKNKKTKKILKILLGIGAAGLALYAANKCIPGFNEKITKPVKEFAKSTASDVKESLIEKEEQNPAQQVEAEHRYSKRLGREEVRNSPRHEIKNPKRFEHRNFRHEKRNF